jgi:5-methylcytosine-specific restriction endonuclease McrA
MVRAHPAAGRRLVDARDRGLCAGCHVDTEAVAGYADQATREVVGRWNHERGLRIHARRWDSAPPELVRMIQVAREEILEPYGWGHLWRRRTFWDADHLVPVADGGPSTLENLQTLCLSCHQAKTLTQRHAAMAAKGP